MLVPGLHSIHFNSGSLLREKFVTGSASPKMYELAFNYGLQILYTLSLLSVRCYVELNTVCEIFLIWFHRIIVALTQKSMFSVSPHLFKHF